jgi:hypothetical protein
MGDSNQQPFRNDLDPTIRLRLATRIHFALLRHYGEDVAVSTLLRGGDAAREALWVCEASEHAELVSLVQQFGAAQKTDATGRVAESAGRTDPPTGVTEPETAAAPQDTAWARQSSGFGMSGPGDLAEAEAPQSGWLSASRWRKRGAARSPG